LLYDLTSLQREANNRFGFSAHRTLQLAQALYERHKAITYPRTDSRALPEDYLGSARQTLEALARTRPYADLRAPDPAAGLAQTQQAHIQQRQNLRSLRHHPDARSAQTPARRRGQDL
jgi:DNA topoisomerase III